MVRTSPRDTQSSSGPQRLLERRHRIEPMDLIEIDVVELQAFQAAGDLIHDMAAGQADRVGAGAGAATHLGRDDHVFTRDFEILQRLAQHDLRLAFGIDVGGIQEIDASFQRLGDQPGRGLLIQRADRSPEAGAAGESHAAQADFRDELAGPAERSIAHGSVLKPLGARRRLWRRHYSANGEASKGDEFKIRSIRQRNG